MCNGVIIENNKAIGVKTGFGLNIYAKSIVLTNGTFLNGLIHLGEKQFGGGRVGEKASTGITEDLLEFGFEITLKWRFNWVMKTPQSLVMATQAP